VSGSLGAAVALDLAAQDLVFDILRKAQWEASKTENRPGAILLGRGTPRSHRSLCVPVLHAGGVAQLLAELADLAGKGDGPVLAAGAAHRDHQLAFALL